MPDVTGSVASGNCVIRDVTGTSARPGVRFAPKPYYFVSIDCFSLKDALYF